MNEANPPVRPRPWRPQFSLKLLLVAFTAFAIGFPIWYRWPYEETDFDSTGSVKRITTWQRQWGGGRAKHGLFSQYWNGKWAETTTYRNGLRHGPYENTHEHGQYENDEKEGVWTARDRTTTWHLGKLDGPAEFRLAPPNPKTALIRYRRKTGDLNSMPPAEEPRVVKLKFVQGRLTEFNGNTAANRLFDRLESSSIDDRTASELRKSTTIDVVEMPLRDCALYLSETHNLPMVLDSKVIPQSDMPITNELRGIDLCSALLLLTAPNGLASDYRYGCIWITTAEDGNDWHDPTGVTEIKPPKGSALALAWNEISPPVDCVQTPLTEVLAYLKQPLAIDIDTSQIEKTTADSSPPLVTLSLRGLRFCDTLGQLLYITDCRCRLEEDKLVILPPNPEAKQQPE